MGGGLADLIVLAAYRDHQARGTVSLADAECDAALAARSEVVVVQRPPPGPNVDARACGAAGAVVSWKQALGARRRNRPKAIAS